MTQKMASHPPRTKHTEYEDLVESLFLKADIIIHGNRSHDISVNDDRFYKRFIKDGSLGLGESYMEGWWDCDRIDEMFFHLFRSMIYHTSLVKNFEFYLTAIKAKLLPEGKKSRSHQIGEKHYDIGNELYRKMLDQRMVYSCGYWQKVKSLDEAQEAKLELACRKLKLESGMRILDVGCGWGSFARYAAEKYQVRVTGVTVSKEQLALAKEHCYGLPVELRFQDYRDVREKYDRIVSIGMFEHVGKAYHRNFMEKMHECLTDPGIFLLHTIVAGKSRPPDPWLEKYIFPGCYPPSLKEIGQALEGQFVMEDIHNFGADYDKTAMEWYRRFEASWDSLKADYDERFRRMWRYYLLSCAAAFRARYSNLYQIVLSKRGIPGGYFFENNYKL